MAIKFKNGGSVAPAEVQNFEPFMTAESIQRRKVNRPKKVVLYSPEGWGKTTFGADSENPVFIATEDGLESVDVNSFPEPKAWEHVTEAVKTLITNDLGHKTLVMDTLDWTEALAHQYLCAKYGKESITDFGYGGGYDLAFDEFKKLRVLLDELRTKRGMDIVILAHSEVKTFKNPMGEDYDRYQLKVHKFISAYFREWADCVLFGNYDISLDVKTDRKGKVVGKAKALGGEDRVIYATHHAAWDAKNRYGINAPLVIPAENPAAEFWKIVKGE